MHKSCSQVRIRTSTCTNLMFEHAIQLLVVVVIPCSRFDAGLTVIS